MHRSICLLGLAAAAAVAAIAACSDSSAPDVRFACLGDTLPTIAPALVNVSGMVTANVLSPQPVPHAFVYAFRTGDTTHLAGDTTNTPGQYSVAIPSGGTPVNGYLAISDSGDHINTYAYPPVPLAGDITQNVLMVSSAEFATLAGAAGITPVAGDGFIGIVVKDCQGTPIAGASVSSNPAGQVRYNAGSIPSSSATHTAADGVAYIANVTAGNVTVMANAGGHALRQHIVNARADAITLTEIRP